MKTKRKLMAMKIVFNMKIKLLAKIYHYRKTLMIVV